MPTYVLEGGAHAMLPAQPLTIRIRGGQVRVRARRSDGTDAAEVLSPGGGILVVPRLDAELVIVVEPDADRFPPATVLDISVAPESRAEADPDQATVSGVDVSGLSGRELLRLEPAAGRVRVTALGIRVDAPLPPLAAAVRDAARGLLRVEALTGEDAVPVVVAVDASASMKALAEQGDLAAALEIVLGLSRVIGGETLTVTTGALQQVEVAAASVDELPTAAAEAVLGAPLRTGFRPGTAVPAGTVQLVVSDAPPPTAAAGRRHGVLLAPRSAWPALQGRRAGVTLIPVAELIGAQAGSAGTADQLLGDEALLRTVTESLVLGVLGPEVVQRVTGVSR